MSNEMVDATLIKLCEGYGRLFAFRKLNAEATHFHEADLEDHDRAMMEYARFEYDKTDRFLERFPSPPDVTGLRVLDLGCRNGGGTVRHAVKGAAFAVGLDLEEEIFTPGRALAKEKGVSDKVDFRVSTDVSLPLENASVDIVLTEDVIEHLAVPEAIFHELNRVLRPGGRVYARFGPLWYHPHGVHLWEVFPGPWTHLLFPERIVCAVRHRHKRDANHGTRYSDLGLNQMSVRRFKDVVHRSGFEVERLQVSGIGGANLLTHVPVVGELFSSEVEAVLRRR